MLSPLDVLPRFPSRMRIRKARWRPNMPTCSCPQSPQSECASTTSKCPACTSLELLAKGLFARLKRSAPKSFDLESAIQDFLVAMARHEQSLPPSEMLPLGLKVIKNKVRDHVRSPSVKRRSVLSDETPCSPEQVAEVERLDLLHQIMRFTGPAEKRFLELALKGHTPEEIAKELGCPRNTIYQVRRRLRRKVSHLLV